MIKTLFRKSIVGLITLGAIVSVFSQTPVQRHGKLTTSGPYILNKNGNIVQLRGMSFYWSRTDWPGYSYYNASTVNALVDDWKCTVVRVAYGEQSGWQGCQAVIDAAIAKGIYVIIDWHSHNANDQGDAPITFFKEKAKQYKSTDNVIFEVYNEPIVAGAAVANDGSIENARKTWTAIKPYLKEATKAIRAEGAENLVLLGTPYYAQHVGVAADDPVTDDNGQPFSNVAYSFHFYAASHGTEVGGLENGYLQFGLGRVPVFVSEWGTPNNLGGGSPNETNTNWWFANYINKEYHLGWCNWSASSHEGSSAFSGGTNPSTSGTIVKRLLSELSVDEYLTPENDGLPGPFNDTVALMPKNHPAMKFNQYYSTSIQFGNIPFNDRDNVDARTAKNTGVTITPATTKCWLRYELNSTSATKYLAIRYLAKNGTGTIEVLLDAEKKGEIIISKNDSWVTTQIDLEVPTNKHTIEFKFVNTTSAGYKFEWIELTNDSDTVDIYQVQHKNSTSVTLTRFNNGYSILLPALHGYTSYTLIGADGRIIRNRKINATAAELRISDLPSGVVFLKLNGLKDSQIFKAVTLKP